VRVQESAILKVDLVTLKAPASRARTRYWSKSWFLYVMGVLLILKMALGVWLTYVCIEGLVTGSWARSTRGFAYFLLCVGVFLILLGAWFMTLAFRPALVLTQESVRIQRGAFHALDVPVKDIAGVGLVFMRFRSAGGHGPPPGWYLTIWNGQEQAERIGIAYMPAVWRNSGPRAAAKFLAKTTPHLPTSAVPRFSLKNFDPAAETDAAKLGATHAARVANQIYQRVLALQGPAGLLADTEKQKHVPVDEEGALAFWSPAGTMSRVPIR
jgi:hypothetical protein